MSTTATTAQNEDPSWELLMTSIHNKMTELERLTGLLKQCSREAAERLKI
jgi:hypothetical protein